MTSQVLLNLKMSLTGLEDIGGLIYHLSQGGASCFPEFCFKVYLCRFYGHGDTTTGVYNAGKINSPVLFEGL